MLTYLKIGDDIFCKLKIIFFVFSLFDEIKEAVKIENQ